MSIFGKIFGSQKRERETYARLKSAVEENVRLKAQNQSPHTGYNEGRGIAAANFPAGSRWPGISATSGDDALNREYLRDLATVQSRAQDLDVNEPNIRGFHRTRTAQVIGAVVTFNHVPVADEVNLDAKALREVSKKIDRIRDLQSRTGGFDAARKRRSEGMLQVQAQLSCFVHGSVLIHRVHVSDSKYPLPLGIELIPGTRISTPYEKQGDPKVSYGIEYTDAHRTKVVGYHVRNVSKTIGDSFVTDPTWTFIPAVDASLLSLTEVAGIDRALPLSVAVVKLSRSMGDFIGSAVETARAQAHHYAITECAEGQSPYDAAQDDADGGSTMHPVGFTNMGNGVIHLYNENGEKTTFVSSKLPNPDFPGFTDGVTAIMARGLASSQARFTREVNNSFAGGRLEEQQDRPIIDQYREAFCAAWQVVNEWFLDAIYLSGAINMPGYSVANACYWAEFEPDFYGEVHINPVQTMDAREKSMALRTTTPQQACREDGKKFERNTEEWAKALKLWAEKEEEYELPPGSLSALFSGRALTTADGAQIAPPDPDKENQPGEEDDDLLASRQKRNGKKNGGAALNRLEVTSA